MNVSDKGIAALIKHEGIVPGPYLDSVGVWTWGIGHTSAAGAPNPVQMPRGVPDDLDGALRRVFQTFAFDLERYAADVRRAVKVPMKQHEFDAAVSFHFNTGAIGRASWVKHWNAGNKAAAAKGIMSWRKPAEIIPRRTDERDLWLHGRYPTGKATVWGVTHSGKVVWRALRTLSQSEILNLMQRPGFTPHVDAPAKKAQPKMNWLAMLLSLFKGKK